MVAIVSLNHHYYSYQVQLKFCKIFAFYFASFLHVMVRDRYMDYIIIKCYSASFLNVKVSDRDMYCIDFCRLLCCLVSCTGKGKRCVLHMFLHSTLLLYCLVYRSPVFFLPSLLSLPWIKRLFWSYIFQNILNTQNHLSFKLLIWFMIHLQV